MAEDQGGQGAADNQQQQQQGQGRGLDGLLNRHGNDAGAVASLLYHDNYTLREELRTLRGKVAPEGAVVLTGDDAAHWQTYRTLGAPDAVQAALTDKERLQGELDGLRRAQAVREAAEAAGYRAAALDRLDRAEGGRLEYTVREETVDGKQQRVAYVKDGDAEQKLADYAAAHWSEFLPALEQEPGRGPQGVPYPAQRAGGKQQPDTTLSVAQSYLRKTYRGDSNNGSNR